MPSPSTRQMAGQGALERVLDLAAAPTSLMPVVA
jgi:hypothetical protein